MKPLTLAQATLMLDTTDRLNALDDPKWQEKSHHWMRKVWRLCANLENDEVTSMDTMSSIWHCMLSDWLQNVPKDEDINAAAALLVSTMYDEQYNAPHMTQVLAKHTDKLTLIDAFVNLASAGAWNVLMFARLLELHSLHWEWYVEDETLPDLCEVFRAAYPDNYTSDWGGESDLDTLRLFYIETPEAGTTELLNRMEVAYSGVTKKDEE